MMVGETTPGEKEGVCSRKATVSGGGNNPFSPPSGPQSYKKFTSTPERAEGKVI